MRTTRFSLHWVGIVATMMSLLAGCSANHKAIHQVDNLDGKDSVVISMDAKQRAIIGTVWQRPRKSATDPNATNSNATDPETTRRFCSEPSPDVFSVVAQSLSVGGSFGQTADPRAIEAALNAAFSSSENGATIARTQANNLLREIMFRTCERYMNGAIDELEMSVQAARDHRIIVSLLAIEQLTGAVTPRPVVIGASGSGTAGASADAILAIEDARKAKERAEKDAEAADKAYGEAKAADKCEADPVAEANKAKCDEKREASSKAKMALGEATERYQLLSSLARAGGVSVSTQTQSDAPGGVLGVQPQSIKDVAHAVTRIVKWNVKTDEFVFFCIRSFSDKEFMAQVKVLDTNGKIVETCIQYIVAGIAAEAEQRFSVDRYLAARAAISGEVREWFDSFWKRVSKEDKFDKEKFQQLEKQLSLRPIGRDKVLLDQIAEQTDKNDIGRNFSRLGGTVQQALATEEERRNEQP